MKVKFSLYILQLYFYFLYIFLADKSVLATPLLMSPAVHFSDVWIRTLRATVVSRRASNLATHLAIEPPISLFSHPYRYLATPHLLFSQPSPYDFKTHVKPPSSAIR
jgi:hypothetical protein